MPAKKKKPKPVVAESAPDPLDPTKHRRADLPRHGQSYRKPMRFLSVRGDTTRGTPELEDQEPEDRRFGGDGKETLPVDRMTGEAWRTMSEIDEALDAPRIVPAPAKAKGKR